MDIHTWFVDKSTTLKKICLHTRIDIACLHTVKWFQLLPTANNSININFLWHTVKWLQELLFTTDKFFKHNSFICTQSKGFKYCQVIPNNSIFCTELNGFK